MNLHLYRLPAVRQQILKQYFEVDTPPQMETEHKTEPSLNVPTYLSRRPVNAANMQIPLNRRPSAGTH